MEKKLSKAQHQLLNWLSQPGVTVFVGNWSVYTENQLGQVADRPRRATVQALVRRGYLAPETTEERGWYQITDAGRAALEAI